MPQIHIPASLRAQADDQAVIEVQGASVGEVLENLVGSYPDLASSLMDADQRVHAFVNLFVDGQHIRDLQQLATRVGPDQSILIVPALAGG